MSQSSTGEGGREVGSANDFIVLQSLNCTELILCNYKGLYGLSLSYKSKGVNNRTQVSPLEKGRIPFTKQIFRGLLGGYSVISHRPCNKLGRIMTKV